jgi:Flp pilus assembly protein TadD
MADPLSLPTPKTCADLLRLALARHREGRLSEAEALYQKVLELQPRQPDALRLSGVLAQQRGELDRAGQLLQQALQAQPDSPDTHHDLGSVWFESGQTKKALAAYQSAIRLRPNFPEAYYNMGNAHYALGERAAAASCYRRAVEQQPDLAEAHYNLGLVAQDEGDSAEASLHYEQALRHRPDYPEALLNLGVVQKNQGQFAPAAASLLKAVALKPDYSEAWLHLGIVRQQENRPAEAEACFRRVLALRPAEISAHLNLALVLDDLGKRADAEQQLKSVLQLAPENPEAHSCMAGLLKKRGCFEEAAHYYRRAIQLDPNAVAVQVALVGTLVSHDKLEEASEVCERILEKDPANVETLIFLGMVRFRKCRPAEAAELYRKALSLNPANPDARLNLAMCELLLGDYPAGFKNYEARWRSKLSTAIPRFFTEPRWQGEALDGRTILLYAEQGLGDAIHLIRYAPLVAQRGGRVLVECPAPLKALFREVPGVSTVAVHGEPLPRFDLQLPFLSLPVVFETTLETIPNKVPYLHVPSGTICAWPSNPRSELQIGLVWSGNPRHANDKTRSIPLAQLAPLWAMRGLGFYSLQVGVASRQLAEVEGAGTIVDLAPQLTDMAVTAAVIERLHLVISVDTAVAHLAGALGKPVWVLLPVVTDWRWLMGRGDSPWYPSMRLFRQKQAGNWSEVVDTLCEQLQHVIRESPRPHGT